MADKLPNSDGERGFAGFSRWVTDISKDIEKLSGQEISVSKDDVRPPHIHADSTYKVKKTPTKFYAWLIIGAFFIAWIGGAFFIPWIGGGFNGNDHAANTSSDSLHQDGKYKKAAIGYYYSGNPLKRHASINVGMERISGRTDAEILVPLAKQMHFDLAGARDGGYSDQEIIESLISNQILDTNTHSQSSSNEKQIEIAPPVIKTDPLTLAPNGKPWPSRTGYLSGLAKLNTGGLSSVTIDNTNNDSNVYLKLFFLSGSHPIVVRHVFIKSGDKFTFRSVSAGHYDVRYRDLRYGGISKTDAFELHEIHEGDGTRYSKMTLTLYKVRDGNMQMRDISEAEF